MSNKDDFPEQDPEFEDEAACMEEVAADAPGDQLFGDVSHLIDSAKKSTLAIHVLICQRTQIKLFLDPHFKIRFKKAMKW